MTTASSDTCPVEHSLIDLLHATTERSNDRIALIHKDRRLTYGWLGSKVESLARFLRLEGVRAGDRVVVILENSPEYVISCFGVMMAGAVVVPVGNQNTPNGIASILKNSTPRAMILHYDLWVKGKEIFQESPFPHTIILAAKGEEKISIEMLQKARVERGQASLFDFEMILAENDRASGKFPRVENNRLAMIIYTSGTTGDPKGVMLSHGNLVSNARSIIQYLGLTESDRAMMVLPCYYSYGNSILTTHMMVGGSLVLENSFHFPNAVLERMVQENVSGFSGVPSTYAILLDRSNIRKMKFPCLRYVTQAGGAMSVRHARELHAVFGGNTKIYIMYGQTEATARLTYLDPKDLMRKAGSIGKAIPGVRITLRGEDSRVVSPGGTGEIVAEGGNIMMGYWNKPEETARVLRPDGLHTGDYAVEDPDGSLFIVGRRTDMIKSGAHRINSREIEEVLLAIPEIEEAAVVGVPDLILGEAITAFVVPKHGSGLEVLDVKRHCRDHLPPYKMPKHIRFKRELPKTGSGKVRKHELVGATEDAPENA